jgi:hypothetical protein
VITKLILWIKNNKAAFILGIVVIFLLINKQKPSYRTAMVQKTAPAAYMQQEAAPTPEITDRKVVITSSFSLLVKNVTDSTDKIRAKTVELGGYVIRADISRPEGSENATIETRVPSKELVNTTKFLKEIAVRVVSENINEGDITDQYTDIEERLSRLEKTKAKFETILERAQTVDEILKVQQSIFDTQAQIDSYKGQLKYMDKVSQTSKLTIYLSTDEIGLPYTPDEPWKPEAIFKQAIRSLVGIFRTIGTVSIWGFVYLPILIPCYIIYRIVKRKSRRK